jgi:NAD(P)-dependent dehydrogenase (short-subunit alcohol dehydrogenase family)
MQSPYERTYKVQVGAIAFVCQNPDSVSTNTRKYRASITSPSNIKMANKTVVFITGANTGLGYEAVKALYKSTQPYEILLGSRSVSKGDDAISSLKKEITSSPSTISTVQIDIESDDSIEKAYDTISSKFGKVDTLINNAGANFDGEAAAGNLSLRKAWQKSWDVNVAGTHVLTTTFVPLLLKSKDPRLCFVTSGTSALTETEKFDYPPLARINASPPAGWPKPASMNPVTCYRSTKTGLNMLMREWVKILNEDGVKVWAISPGFLATGLGGIGSEQLKKVSSRALTVDLIHTDKFS